MSHIDRLIRAICMPPRIIYNPKMLTGQEVAALSLSCPGDLVPVVHGEALRVIPQRPIVIRMAHRKRVTAAMQPTMRRR